MRRATLRSHAQNFFRTKPGKMALHPEYKIILLGDPRVGKTTFFLRIKEGDFVDTELRPTASLGVEHLEFQHKIGGVDVKVNDA